MHAIYDERNEGVDKWSSHRRMHAVSRHSNEGTVSHVNPFFLVPSLVTYVMEDELSNKDS